MLPKVVVLFIILIMELVCLAILHCHSCSRR